jgi:hypothetical protein
MNSTDDLIPELPLWNNGKGIDIDSWIGCLGQHEHAIGYLTRFWPKFIEHGGGVFLGSKFNEKSFDGFMTQTKGDVTSVERVLNHIHLFDWFLSSPKAPTRAQLLYLAETLRDAWSTKLARDFPSRRFVFDLYQEDQNQPDDLVLSFHSEKAAGVH